MSDVFECGCKVEDCRNAIVERTDNERIRGAVEWMWNEKLDINGSNGDGFTLLYLSCQENEFEIVEYLLGIGADPSIIPPNGMPAWSFILSTIDGIREMTDLYNTDGRHLDARIRILQTLYKMDVMPHDDRIDRTQFLFFIIFLCNNGLKVIADSMLANVPVRFLEMSENLQFDSHELIKFGFSIFAYCCIKTFSDTIDMLLDRGCPVNEWDFFYAFVGSSLTIVQNLCNKRPERFDQFYLASLILRPNRDIDEFVVDLMKTKNLREKCVRLYHLAAANGNSDLIETIFKTFPPDTFAYEINDDLIAKIFVNSTKRRNDEGVSWIFGCECGMYIAAMCTMGVPGMEETRNAKSFYNYAETLSLMISAAGQRTGKPVEELFDRNETKVVARFVKQNRGDVVEKLLKYHHQCFNRLTFIVWAIYEEQQWYTIDAMCCAVSCLDYDLVRLLTDQGESINHMHSECDRRTAVGRSELAIHTSSEFSRSWWHTAAIPSFLCAFQHLSCYPCICMFESPCADVALDNNSALEIIGSIIRDFADVVVLSRNYEGCSVVNILLSNMRRFVKTAIVCACQGQPNYVDMSAVEKRKKFKRFKFSFDLLRIFFDFGWQFVSDECLKPDLSNFVVYDELTKAVMSFLFQAFSLPGSAMLSSIKEANYHHSSKRFSMETLNTDLCKVLVLERSKHFVTGVAEFEHYMDKHADLDVPCGIRSTITEFLAWYGEVTSSPFSLQCQCRTFIRKMFTSVSNRRSILPRIESLDLPDDFKKYLKYEGCLTEVSLAASFQESDLPIYSLHHQ